MEVSGLTTSQDDAQGRALKGLLDAFGSVFSLEEIASAYCKAGRNAALAGTFLYDSRETSSTSSTLTSNSEMNSKKSLESSCGSNSENSRHSDGNRKASKTKLHPASMGTVASVRGKDYGRHVSLAKGVYVAKKPVKLDSKDSPIPELREKPSSTSSADKNRICIDTEEFLLKMLGDGFKLDRDLIQQVLRSCGYDMKKSMEKLLDLSAGDLDKRENFESFKKPSGQCREMDCLLNVASNGNGVLETNGIELPREQNGRNDIQKELLTSLFNVSKRPEEIYGKAVTDKSGNRLKPFGQVVDAPLGDNLSEHKTGTTNPLHINEDEDESYNCLRRAVKEYRDTMKEYYKAAVEAFAEGDHARADKLLEEGNFFHKKAREADEESVQKIFESRGRNEETEEAICLDLHNLSAKEALRLLKCHLSSLCGIPTNLKVIVEKNDQDDTKGGRKRVVIRLLEKESIKWTEQVDGRTILINLDKINPENLNFARKI